MRKISVFLIIISTFIFDFKLAFAQLNSDWQRYCNNTYGVDILLTDKFDNSYSFLSIGNSVFDYDPGPAVHVLDPQSDFVILKLDSSGNTLWLKELKMIIPANIQPNRIHTTVDSLGNFYLMSIFQGTFDIDPDTSVFLLNPILNSNTFIAKFDTDGNLLWAKTTTQPDFTEFKTINCDANNNLFISGNFNGTFDIDFNASVQNISPIGSMDVIVAKYDPNGNLLWNFHQGFPGSYLNISVSKVDNNGSIISFGSGSNQFDFDPGPGVDSVYLVGNYSTLGFKIDQSGNLEWVTELINLTFTTNQLCIAPDNSFMIVGNNSDYLIGDHLHPDTLAYTSGSQIVLIKYNSNGEVMLAKEINTEETDYQNVLMTVKMTTMNNEGNIAVLILANVGIDLDPGLGLVAKKYLTNPLLGSYQSLVCYDNLGNYLWDITDKLEINDIYINNIIFNRTANSFYIGSISGDLNLDTVSPGFYNIYAYARYKETACANLGIAIDSLNPSTCNVTGYASSHAFGGIPPYDYAWNSTPSTNNSDASLAGGLYHLSVSDSVGCLVGREVFIDGPATNSNFDLQVDAFSADFVAGFEQVLFINMTNLSCDSVSGTLNFIRDPLLTILGSIPPISSFSGDTLKWDFIDYNYLDTSFSVALHIRTKSIAQIGDTINYEILALPVIGDNDSLNNHKKYSYPVFSSFDPNDKKVSPQGESEEGYIANNTLLNYTIRFQNTGNYVATNIVLLDTIDSNLNYLSLHVNSASHLYTVEYLPNNIVKFKFLNIMLPDSTSSYEASMGYINYSIEQKANLAPSTEIKNTAYIYFDYNPAVITNTTLNTIYPLITNTINNVILNDIAISPNPAHQFINIKSKVIVKEIKVFDISGNLIFSSNYAHEKINISELSNGLYFIEIVDSNGNAYRHKFIKN